MDAHTIEETLEQYDRVFSRCAELFEAKTADYGTAWRILRPSSLTDQLFIKANRIRTLQQSILMKVLRVKQIENNDGQTNVSEGVEANYQDMANYALFALILLDLTDVSGT
jgi:hypothetical protein